MNSACISLLTLAMLSSAWPAMAQNHEETILPAVIPTSQPGVKARTVLAAKAKAGSATIGAVKSTSASPALNAPHATLFSENSGPMRDQTVHYYIPVGAVSPQSGIRTYPGTTAAHITNGATRISSGIPAGSTFARLAGTTGSRAIRPSTKARTVSTR